MNVHLHLHADHYVPDGVRTQSYEGFTTLELSSTNKLDQLTLFFPLHSEPQKAEAIELLSVLIEHLDGIRADVRASQAVLTS